MTGIQKLVLIPIVRDTVDDTNSTIVDSTEPSEIIRRINPNTSNLSNDIRLPLLSTALHHLSENPSNPYTVHYGQDVDLNQMKSEKMSQARSLADHDVVQVRPWTHQSVSDSEGSPVDDFRNDPVEGNRTSLSYVSSVFMPDGLSPPRSIGFPVNFLLMKNPYVTSLPMFFPNGKGGLHDEDRVNHPTENELVLHYLRNVKKELQEDYLFTSLAALRLETNKLYSCHNALRGFNVNRENEAVLNENQKLRFMHHAGSIDYYIKQNLDMQAKSDVFGFPQIFYTFTCSNHWEVTLASVLMQEGYKIAHVDDEPDSEYLVDTDPEKEYTIHLHSSENANCPSHRNCERAFASDFLDRNIQIKKNLLDKNLYTINRIFQQRSRSLIENVLKSTLSVKAYHDVKEFANGFPHIHGVAWRQLDGTEAIFKKIHEGEMILEAEYLELVTLADSLLCVSTNSIDIERVFPSLTSYSAELIARLAAKHQRHTCSDKCERETKAFCWYNYPQEPSATTLVSFPPTYLDQNVAKNLVFQ